MMGVIRAAPSIWRCPWLFADGRGKCAIKRVTIKDIARLAGVSYATVSRALSGSGEISDATRVRVLEICKQQGYRANVLARSLTGRRTHVLGLIIPTITNPFYAELSLGIETCARAQGYHIMLCNSQPDGSETEALFDFLVGHQADGVILASSSEKARFLAAQYGKTVPTVLVGGAAPEDGGALHAVSADNYTGGQLGADYLRGLGHTDIVYLGYRPASSAHRLRLSGFRSAMARAGLPVRVLEADAQDADIPAGCKLAREIFTASARPTAVFAATDSLAVGVLQAADECGVSIPEELSLLGYDNLLYASLPRITLSTIDQRKQALAEAAVETLLALIEAPTHEPGVRRLVAPALVERGTCRARTDQ